MRNKGNSMTLKTTVQTAIRDGLKYINENPKLSFYFYESSRNETDIHGNSMSVHHMLVSMRGGYGHDLTPDHREALKAIFKDEAIPLCYHKRMPPTPCQFEHGKTVHKIEPL